MTTPEFFGHPTTRRRAVGIGAATAMILSGLRLSLGDALAQDQPVVTFVIAGIDTRTPEEPENTDVLMIARVDLNALTVRALSLPRDLYVEIPGVGYDKINRAYDYGSKANDHSWDAGIALTRDTIAANFGVTVDAGVTTNFTGFAQLIDAIGGVDVENPYDLYDGEYPTADYGTKEIFYPAGANHLTGEQALEFSRTRHQDGDDGRVMRQQLVLLAALDRLQEIADPDALATLVTDERDAVSEDVSDELETALLDAVLAIDPANVTFGTITDQLWGDTIAATGMWVYQGDWSTLPGYVQAFLDGQV